MTRTLQLVVRSATALALLAVAAPALPCGDAKTSMAVKESPPATTKEKVATQAPAPKVESKEKKQATTPTATASR